jgi:exodeoxyribonuclease VII small subunit
VSGERETLEEALERLDRIARSLESGEVELQESLELYEEGIRLVRLAEESLRAAELRVERLNADGSVTPLEPESGSP